MTAALKKDIAIVVAEDKHDLLSGFANKVISQFRIGNWVICTMDGLMTEDDTWSFTTKEEAIRLVSDYHLDGRKHKTVKRVCKGVYDYEYPDCDNRTIRHHVSIERITAQNRNRFRQIALATLEKEPDDPIWF